MSGKVAPKPKMSKSKKFVLGALVATAIIGAIAFIKKTFFNKSENKK